jgi:hypothetical protein
MEARSQEQTLVGSGDLTHGGYGGPVVRFTSIRGEGAVMAGGRGGWIINHRFVLGGAGYGLTSTVDARTPGPFGEPYLEFSYGGVTLEYVINSDRVVHGSVELLVGSGSISRRMEWDGDRGGPEDVISVIEPGATVDLNVTPWFRLSAGASYRFVSGSRRGIATNADVSSASGSLIFRFGKF